MRRNRFTIESLFEANTETNLRFHRTSRTGDDAGAAHFRPRQQADESRRQMRFALAVADIVAGDRARFKSERLAKASWQKWWRLDRRHWRAMEYLRSSRRISRAVMPHFSSLNMGAVGTLKR